MPRGDEQRPDPFWEEAEEIDLATLHGTMQYGQPHARGGHVHLCPLCGGFVYNADHRRCRKCAKSTLARQVDRMMEMLKERRLRHGKD